MATPFIFLDQDSMAEPDPGPRLFISHAVRSNVPVDSSSVSCKFVLEGEENYIIGGRAHRLLAGDFIIVDAGVAGSIDIPRRERTIALSAFLGGSAGDALLPGYGPVMRPPKTTTLGKLLHQTAAAYARDPGSTARDASSSVDEIRAAANAFAVSAFDRLQAINLKKPESRQELLARLERARAYLQDNSARSITLAEVSRVAAMSVFHFNRHFKTTFGEPPMRYHRRLQLKRVAVMLTDGAVSPSAAAEMLGYSDLPSFTRAFKSMTGSPPSALRPI
jgi:AraC-like DNA-binding protein